jgi:hypothetical protein
MLSSSHRKMVAGGLGSCCYSNLNEKHHALETWAWKVEGVVRKGFEHG